MRRTSPRTESREIGRFLSNILICGDNPTLLAGPHLSGPTPSTLSLSSEIGIHPYCFPLSPSVVLSKGTSRGNQVTLQAVNCMQHAPRIWGPRSLWCQIQWLFPDLSSQGWRQKLIFKFETFCALLKLSSS